MHHEGMSPHVRCVTGELTCVVELGVVIGKNGRDIPKSEAESYIAGYSEIISFKFGVEP